MEATASGRARQAQRPLEQEPLLAARIMIEDCMNLLLDVEDIDRLCTAGPPGQLPTCIYPCTDSSISSMNLSWALALRVLSLYRLLSSQHGTREGMRLSGPNCLNVRCRRAGGCRRSAAATGSVHAGACGVAAAAVQPGAGRCRR